MCCRHPHGHDVSPSFGLAAATVHHHSITPPLLLFVRCPRHRLQGEYIAAEKVENALLSAWVQQIFVYGDSFHSTLIAIVVPNPDTAK